MYPSDRDEGRVLLQADEVVQQRRDHATDGLRDDDEPHGLAAAQPERSGRGDLRGVDRLDAGPVDLGDVGRVHEDERHDRPEEVRVRHALDLQRRRPEPQQQDHQDRRDGAEQVRVDGREDAQRREHGAPQAAHHGDDHREDQHEDLGHHEDEDVPSEPRHDLRQGIPEHLRVEERLLDLRPPRRVQDREREQPEHDHGAHDGDRHATSSLGLQRARGSSSHDRRWAACSCPRAGSGTSPATPAADHGSG